MTSIDIIKGDITELAVDAIVNAANTDLLGGGGVDGAIRHAGGSRLSEDARVFAPLYVAHAAITNGYDLPAKKVIWTVGPQWNGGSSGEFISLAETYKNCLRMAERFGLTSIAFPAISAGVYGFPLDKATKVAIEAVLEESLECRSVQEVVFVCFNEATMSEYKKRLPLARKHVLDKVMKPGDFNEVIRPT
jgi:O-acetyl-ADP-ribose deacetylase (regulator of RNase III)